MAHDNYHAPVLTTEVLDYLNVTQTKKYIDATLGGGGHSFEILKSGGRVLGIDVDSDSLKFVEELISQKNTDVKLGEDLVLVQGNFRNLDQIAKNNNFTDIDGILFDLGVSSHQLDTPQRGFSFQNNGPLDMRMDQNLSVSAKDLVNGLTRDELVDLFTRFGEEGFARQIANSISSKRLNHPIETTEELAQIIEKAVKVKSSINPSTKVFQALRIVVNDELNALTDVLPIALSLLKNNGHLVVITFHSLEDRIVKKSFEDFENKKMGKILTPKPVIPTDLEMSQNRRARSAKLRVFEKQI